jgi:hypothetical protein
MVVVYRRMLWQLVSLATRGLAQGITGVCAIRADMRHQFGLEVEGASTL